MSDITRSLVSGGVVVLSIGAIIAGLIVRDHQDLGGSADPEQASVGGLIASREGAEVPADRFFAQMVEKLKREYVDPIDDDQKLASGSVRGMVASLNDPNSVFMDAKEYAAFKESLAGHYQGIGAELSLEDAHGPAATGQASDTDKDEVLASGINIPKLTVVGLTPNGPAARAGVKIGDSVEYVDNRWLIQEEPIKELRQLTLKVNKKAASMDELIKKRKELRKKLEKFVLPLRARDELMIGESGTVNVVWRRGATRIPSVLKREKSEMPGVVAEPTGTLHVSFGLGSADKLKAAIQGKKALVLDLRNTPVGDFDEMKACLAAVAPKGNYGVLESERQGKTRNLALTDGNATPPQMTIKVDRSTRGVAEIFALALQSKGLAKLEGGPTAGHRYILETVKLPDGSAYTLVTGKYRSPSEKPAKRTVKKSAPETIAQLGFRGEVDA